MIIILKKKLDIPQVRDKLLIFFLFKILDYFGQVYIYPYKLGNYETYV